MIELWTHKNGRTSQRLYGRLAPALEAAQAELEAGNAVQIIPGPPEPEDCPDDTP